MFGRMDGIAGTLGAVFGLEMRPVSPDDVKKVAKIIQNGDLDRYLAFHEAKRGVLAAVVEEFFPDLFSVHHSIKDREAVADAIAVAVAACQFLIYVPFS